MPADLVIGAYRSQRVYVLRYEVCVHVCVAYCTMHMEVLKQKNSAVLMDFLVAQKTNQLILNWAEYSRKCLLNSHSLYPIDPIEIRVLFTFCVCFVCMYTLCVLCVCACVRVCDTCAYCTCVLYNGNLLQDTSSSQGSSWIRPRWWSWSHGNAM